MEELHEITHRERTLTDGDVEAIAKAVHRMQSEHFSNCRFDDLDPDVLRGAVKFYENFNKAFDETKGIVGKTLLVLFLTSMFGVFGLGVLSKLGRGQ